MSLSPPKRLPTMEEFEKILSYLETSWIFISDDDMYEMKEIEFPMQTLEIEKILSSITGNPVNVER
jgi:hypothetical protein